ncbi:MAG: hypothetical protein K6B52_08650 [Clostridiales bacterium]|nr:hypothetical protein [Clostridiales bacterium]
MIDIHTHICYGVDDGAQEFIDSVDMLYMAAESYTGAVVLTPHTNLPGNSSNLWGPSLSEKFKRIRNAAIDSDLPLQVFFGQEIFFDENTVDLFRKGYLITINNSRYPLVEFDFGVDFDYCRNSLEQLLKEGLVPVIAHPERYNFVSEDHDAAFKLRQMGCIIQLDKDSVLGNFGRSSYVNAKTLLSNHIAQVVASDCHSTFTRSPDLKECFDYIADAYDFDYAAELFELNPGRILRDMAL